MDMRTEKQTDEQNVERRNCEDRALCARDRVFSSAGTTDNARTYSYLKKKKKKNTLGALDIFARSTSPKLHLIARARAG